MAPEVASVLRRALTGVVATGTATRLKGAYAASDGALLPVGGKTGTGDNRFETFGNGHSLVASRVVDRTATFVFFLGDRFFGTVTAYVPGRDAADYHFTSALAVSLLKALSPELTPLIAAPQAEASLGEIPQPRAALSTVSTSIALPAPPATKPN
jgi:membrane peptidoglycan carboxypeptidase